MLLPSQQLNENFNLLDKDIKNGSLSKIKKDFEQIKKFSAHRDYGYISGKIMWRLLASIRKNSLEVAWASVYNREKLPLHRQNLYRVSRLLSEFLPDLKVDDHNRHVAQVYIQKHHLNVSAEVKSFLAERPSNGRRYYSTRQRLKNIRDFYNHTEDYSFPEFRRQSEEFFGLLSDNDVEAKNIHFTSLYAYLQRRGKKHAPELQLNIFEESSQPSAKNTIDKSALAEACRLYVAQLVARRTPHTINPHILQKFPAMLNAAVRKNSFTRKEVKELAKILKTHSYVSSFVEDHLNRTANRLVDVYDKKQECEIKGLHEWMGTHAKKQPLEKAALTNTYLKMLHRKLLNDVDIGGEKYNNLYFEEKKRLQQKVLDAYAHASPEEKSLHRKEIQNQILLESQKDQQQEFNLIISQLQKKCKGISFYYDILNTARRQGLQTFSPAQTGLYYTADRWDH